MHAHQHQTSSLVRFAPHGCRSIATRVLATILVAFTLGGCGIGQLVGGMAESARRSGSTDVKAKYTKLDGKSFAVIVAADRAIQADFPTIVSTVTVEVTRRVAEKAGAAGVVPAEDVLLFQGRRPGWVAMSPREVADALGVERLIYIDLDEYTLTDPGNRYVWKGVAAGIVGVVETDNKLSEDFAFRQNVQVTFPDRENTGPMEIPEDTVQQALLLRLVNRCSWLFFDHEEANTIEY